MGDIVRDLRYAARQLRRTPGFTAAAVLTLALGIGANTALFSIVDALAFRPIAAVPPIDDVSVIATRDNQSLRVGLEVPFADLEALEAAPPASISAAAGVAFSGAYLIKQPGRAEYVLSERISGQYARLFDLRAQVGRWLADEDNTGVAGRDVVVISDRLWREWFDARPDVAGREALNLNGTPHTVVGVATPDFHGVHGGLTGQVHGGLTGQFDLWVPLGHPPPPNPDRPSWQQVYGATIFVKRRTGHTDSQMTGQVLGLLARQPPAQPAAKTRLELLPAHAAVNTSSLNTLTLGILAFSLLVFCAACANLANMLHARGAERAGEIAVRLSLGARPWRVLRLFMTEAALIAGAAAMFGLAMAIAATQAFGRMFPSFRVARELHVTLDLSPDYRVLLAAFGAGTLAALLVGLGTAWRSSRAPLQQALAGGSAAVITRRGRGVRTLLVSVQITAAVLLLISAGLFLQNTSAPLRTNTAYDTSVLTSARVQPALPEQRPDTAAYDPSVVRPSLRIQLTFERILDAARHLPGIDSAVLASALPGGTLPPPRSQPSGLVAEPPPDGLSGTPRRFDDSFIAVSPGFFAGIGLPILRGRGFLPGDNENAAPVAVLSETAAAGLWPHEDPIGKRVSCCGAPRGSTPELTHWITVVGVAADPVRPRSAFVFTPAAQHPQTEMLVVLRSTPGTGAVDALRAAVRSVDENAAVLDAAPVDEILLAGVATERAVRLLTGSLGLISLGIAVLGVYGVVAFFVSRRVREFGLRLALGATPRQVLRLVVDHAIHIVLVGLLPGVFLSSIGTRLFESSRIRIMPNGIDTWVEVPLLILAAGIVAALVPATRASRVDPNVALREL